MVITTLINLLLFIHLAKSSSDQNLAWYSTEPVLSSIHPASQKTVPLRASSAIDFCQLAPDTGKCSQQLVRYYYDATVDECKRFTFSGCGGNSNRFMRRAHCRNRCVKRLDKGHHHHKHHEASEKESKHRRTVTTTTTTPTPTVTKETNPPPITPPVNRVQLTQSGHPENVLCRDCDPLFGTCNNGVCGCLKGFRSLGKVCIDLNECDNGPICGPNARCVNTVGSYTCECDSGFQVDGECKIGPDACMDEFDVNLTEEDCNHGKQEIKYYYDSEDAQCKQFFYGGCSTKSRNFFADLQTCDTLCASQQREYLKSKGVTDDNLPRTIDLNPSSKNNGFKSNHYKIDLLSSPSSLVQPDKPLSVADWPLRPVTVNPGLNLDFSKGQDVENKELEAEKALKIINDLTPDHDQCNLNFKAAHQEECISAEWVERFYWNAEFSDCEPFWYDSSCDPRDVAGKNFFESFEKCKASCANEDSYIVPSEGEVEISEAPEASEASEPSEPSEPSEASAASEPSSGEQPETISTNQEPEAFEFFKIDDKPRNYLEDELEKDVNVSPPPSEVKETLEVCTTDFDPELRNECKTADWEELFYWNQELKECEAFWHDASCSPPEFGKTNVFKNHEECSKSCVEGILKPTEEIIIWPTPTTTANTVPVSPKYNPNNPLNLILTEALNPDKSSTLPEKFPPKMEEMFLNFATKAQSPTESSAGITKFDRLKYMAEFRKKLLALPVDFSTKESPTVPTTTLGTTTLGTIPTTTTENQRSTTTSFEDFVAAEKVKVEKTLNEIDRPADFCDEPLHPKLEEDCNNEKWEIRWFFNTDRGSCKSFWYGGCEVETRNFFPDHANCRHSCAHKYATPASFAQNSWVPPGQLTTPSSPRKDRLTTSLRLTYPHSENLFPAQDTSQALEIFGSVGGTSHSEGNPQEVVKIVKIEQRPQPDAEKANIVNISEGDRKTEEAAFYSHIDKVIDGMRAGDDPGFQKPEEFVRRVESASNDFVKYDVHQPDVVTFFDGPGPPTDFWTTTRNPSTRSINDPCDDEYDPKWDEDCLGDEWVVRSYYDVKSADCKAFWYGGCQTSSRNIWFDKSTCRKSCAHKFPTTPALVTSDQGVDTSNNDDAAHPKAGPSPETVIFVSGSSHVVPYAPHKTLKSPIILKIKARLANTHEFKVDLDLKMAELKREHEGKEELEYSEMVQHPVTVAAECLESFNESLAKPCGDGKSWKNRYFYDKDTRTCRMFWNNDCFTTSKNNFDDLETCQWKCEGRHPQPAGRSCLDKFDQNYLEDCRHGEFTSRFYFDHDRKKCVAFHWGGCQSKSQNFFADMSICQELCESPPRELTQACVQPFDEGYQKVCSTSENPQQYYYFDMLSGTCKMFWFGNCKGENQNIFSTLESCQWICERKREERKPAVCADRFDVKYTESCGEGKWIEKWYFDQSSGECTSFWWDGCTSTSQNIFPDEISCNSNCRHPGFEISSKLASDESKFRCLEPVEIGSCQETYPAFYYDRVAKTCRPFAYSGCGGNSNRFMTISQCENLCFAFNHMNDAEIDCHLPMHIGYGKNDESCLPQAGFRFYFDRNYGKCSQMWYLGCGGNANNFYSYDICQRTCSTSTKPIERKTRASEVCFEPDGDRGTCGKNASTTPLTRWTYSKQLKCTQFTYSGCGGNRNRFATESLCDQTCKGLKTSNDPRICSYQPDCGACNQLRYVWFYNQTRGTCDQFLYGGCGGNPNRFDTFESCQKTCEVTGSDPCMDSLDRGQWCEAMSNRYYFAKRARQCKGFHYTGCGSSGNNFLTIEDCRHKCERRHARAALPGVVIPKKKSKSKSKLPHGYTGTKPIDKTPMIRHLMLNGDNQTYFKSEPQWMDYNFCYGYRYNVSGRDTILNVHFCSLQGSADCISESYRTTDGEEYCNVMRPFLRGQNLYSFYFGLDSKPPAYTPSDGISGRIQRKNETIAAILILKANHCYEIC